MRNTTRLFNSIGQGAELYKIASPFELNCLRDYLRNALEQPIKEHRGRFHREFASWIAEYGCDLSLIAEPVNVPPKGADRLSVEEIQRLAPGR